MAGDDLEQQIAALRRRADQAREGYARAEYQASVAQGREEAALAALKAEFGVDSAEAAEELLARTRDDLAAACAEAERALEEAGG